jgi:aspartate/methionine/tyrosine aminotransferase
VLALYSLSKQSNLAGYRAGFVAGCSDLIAELLAVRKHIGLIPPAPVQAAMITALGDDAHVSAQREL